jgi:very-short-patch-repair endonuclease
MSDAERKLWSALRNGRLAGLKVRRQQPIGRYIADFFCARARLVVEVDGHQHWDEDQKWHDYHRTKWLESKGYRVVRFTSIETLRHTGAVVDAIREAARSSGAVPPSVAPAARQLPPQGGKR